MSHPNAEWLKRYLAPLVNCRVISVEVKEIGGEAWPVINVVHIDGTDHQLTISRDEEGNGPGFIFGLPTPDTDRRDAQG